MSRNRLTHAGVHTNDNDMPPPYLNVVVCVGNREVCNANVNDAHLSAMGARLRVLRNVKYTCGGSALAYTRVTCTPSMSLLHIARVA